MKSRHRILIVEDEEVLRSKARLDLERAGYEVDQACDGVEGLKRFADHRPDIIVTDIQMPRMDGVQFCKSIREVSDVPILIWSSMSEDLSRAYASNLEVDDCADKFIEDQEFLARVGRLVA